MPIATDGSGGQFLRLRRAMALSDGAAVERRRARAGQDAASGVPRGETLALRLATSLSSLSGGNPLAPGRGDGNKALQPSLPVARGFRLRFANAMTPVLLAQSAAGDSQIDVPRRDGETPAIAGGDPAGGDGPDKPALPFLAGWAIPPIRWGGQLITDLRADRSNDQPGRLLHMDIATIKGSSYIWEPWFLRVSGGLGLITSKEYQKDNPGTVADQAQKNARSQAVSGNIDLNLFPVSRFPLNAFFDVSDSRTNAEASGNDTTNTRMGLTQSYRPPVGPDNYTVSFNRSTLESAAAGRDTVNALAGSVRNVVGPQAFDVSGSHTTNTRSNTGEGTALSNLSVRHSYSEESDLSVDSFASLNNSEFHLLSRGVPSQSRSRFLQGNTFVNWRPDEDMPLFITGGARVFRSSIASVAGAAETTTLSGNLAATYALNSQTSLSGAATVTQVQSGGAGSLLTSQTASVSHSGDPLAIAGFDYGWNAGATAGNQSALGNGSTSSTQNLAGQIGHNATRAWSLAEDSQLAINLGQNFGTSFGSGSASAQTLNHNGSVSWRVSRDAATSAYVSLLGSDSRTFGLTANHFQMLNFQASGQLQFNRNSMAALNMTLQGVKQSTVVQAGLPAQSSAPGSVNASGNANFTHSRVFDVPRLRYTATYAINDTQFTTRLEGDFNAPRERISQSFEQRFDYSLGRVAMRLSMRFATIEGRRDALIFLRIIREIGGY